MKKLAGFISHPIQYQSPLYKKLTESGRIDLIVYYYSKHGVEKSLDPQFGKVFKWDIPILEGYKFKFLKNHSLFSGFHFFGFINFSIFKEIIKNKYDAVLINSWSYLSDWFVVLAGVLTKTPVFLRAENPFNQEILKSKWKLWLKKIILGKILFPRIKTFLYIGEENKKFYKFYGVPNEKLVFTPYAVDNSRFINEAINLKSQICETNLKNSFRPEIEISSRFRENLKNDLGINPNAIVILFVGKLIEKKRPMDLLKAFQNVSSRISHISLLFVGDGELKPRLEKYVKDNKLEKVYFVGFKNQTELPRYYAVADVFVLPSGAGETWGLVVNEAMCFGLPIIISDLVGCGTDLVKYNENGYILPVGNIEKLSEYLEELINNENKRKIFGEKSLEIVQKYNYGNVVDGILKALELSG